MMIAYWLLCAFLVGAAVGSFINVCVARLPYEKSLIWPGSRCGHCRQPIRFLFDNIPLVSYWLLRGRCRTCGHPFSIRYFLVELFTGLAFAGLFYLEIFANGLNLNSLKVWGVDQGHIPLRVLPVFLMHATLLSFLIITSLCDLDDMEIPLTVTVMGTLVGLLFATLCPWPYPDQLPPPSPLSLPGGLGLSGPLAASPLLRPVPPVAGVYPWPVWYPLPDWLPAGSWQLGLVTGLAGALAGMVVLRAVRFLFGLGRGLEGLGMGDADLMMMAGSFVGWQVIVMAFFVSVAPALFFALIHFIRKGNQALPFGPSLAAGVLLTLFLWPHISRPYQFVFFDGVFMLIMAGAGAVILLVTAFLLRLTRGTGR
jgi:leader peptidase (prepilin peptidase)/N-methyltransferase